MLGLMIKDFLVGKRYLRSLAMLIAVYIVFAIISNNYYIISGIVAMLALLFCLSGFTYDDAAKWDAYAASMPVKRRTIVISRYVVALAVILISTVLCGLILFLISAFRPVEPAEILSSLLGCALGGTLIICLYVPLVYRFGTEKSRYLVLGIFVVVALAGFLISKFKTVSLPSLSLPLLIVAGVLFVVLSFVASICFYERKEF